ncbi:MAG TPA: phosphatase PAP2 family protein [Gemmataceae bacterium]|nr:phosphatase PAP2 family protein [Gemmataceae bacterium]
MELLEDRRLLSGDPVLEWNAVALGALRNDSLLGASAKQAGPDRASRALAIVQSAVFDAVNSIDRSYEPYLVEVNAPAGASIPAAVAQAAHDTLAALFPDYLPTLNATLAADLAAVASPVARTEGALVGHVVAGAILAVRSHDGADVPMSYTPGTQPGDWQPDPLHPNQKAVGPLWGQVTPFTLRSAEQFPVPAPPALNSPAYTAAFDQVKALGGDGVTTPTTRTADQSQIATFWSYDGSPGIGTPPVMYNEITETVSRLEHTSVIDNARLFALVNLGMADASIACWGAKYEYNYWRPVTAIRDAALDGNAGTTADPGWAPLGAMADNGSGTNFTPPFPSYSSGHATFGGTLFTVLSEFYGTNNVHFTLGSDEYNGATRDQSGSARPVVTRSYASFSQAMWENAMSRIYMGVHWVFDATAGVAQGSAIGKYVFCNFLRPVRPYALPGGTGPFVPWLAGRSLSVDGTTEVAYGLTATRGGPVLTPISVGHGRLVVPQDFRLSGSTPVGLVVKAESARLIPTAIGNPRTDLDDAFASPSLLRGF